MVETLLRRGAAGDLFEAGKQIEWLANVSADNGWAAIDIMVLRLRALMARARGDDTSHKELASRYRAMAESLGFEGHLAWAAAMIDGAA